MRVLSGLRKYWRKDTPATTDAGVDAEKVEKRKGEPVQVDEDLRAQLSATADLRTYLEDPLLFCKDTARFISHYDMGI